MKEKLIFCRRKSLTNNSEKKLQIFYYDKMKKINQDKILIILVNKVKGLILQNQVIDLIQKCKINLIIIKNIQLHFIPIFTGMISNLKIPVKMNITIFI